MTAFCLLEIGCKRKVEKNNVYDSSCYYEVLSDAAYICELMDRV